MKEKYQLASQSKRQSTDIFCLIFFIFFTLGLLLAGLYLSFHRESIDYSIPYDVDGKGCGTDYPQFKYIYFPSPQSDSIWRTTCVKECPGQNDKTVKCQINSKVKSCNENNSAINSQAFHIYGTEVVRGTVCMPKSQTLQDSVLDAANGYYILQVFDSVLKDWSFILLSILIMGVISLVCLLLIRFIARYIIYLLYMLSFLIFLAFGIYLAIPSHSSFAIKKNRPLSIALAALSVTLGLIVLFLYISYQEKIKGAIKYIMRSNQFFKNNYSILFMPLIITGCLVLFFFFWLFLTFSFYQPSFQSDMENHLPFQHFQLSIGMICLLVLSFTHFIWCLFLLMHATSFIVSGTLIGWKFNRQSPHLNAYRTFMVSHLGSACVSSLLTTLFGLFKFEVDEAQCGQLNEENQSCCCVAFFKRCYGVFCCCCINFLFKCFHHAAFSLVNLTAHSYCQASSQVALIIKEECVKWSTVLFLYRIFNDFVPIILSISNVLLSNVLIDNITYFQTNTSNKTLLFATIFIISYSVCQFFLTIYSESIQTSLVFEYFHSNMQNKQKYAIQFEQEDRQQDKYQKGKQGNKKPN